MPHLTELTDLTESGGSIEIRKSLTSLRPSLVVSK